MADPTSITSADIQAAIDSTTSAAPASDASAPSTPDSSASAAAPATSAPEDADLNAPEWGDIPPARRPSIAKNIREKTERQVREQYEKDFGWTKGIDRADFEAYRREQAIAGSMSPADYVANLWRRVESDPQHGPQLRSMAARILGQRQQPPQVPADPEPEPDIPTDASNGVPVVYSAKQQRLRDQWLERQILQKVGAQLAPLQETHQSLQSARQVQAMRQEADAFAARTLDTVSKWPGFKEHAAAILEKYAALGVQTANGWMPDPNDPRSEGEKLRDLYSEVVLPTLTSAARQQAVDDITRKAGASTVSPHASSTGQPFNHKTASWKESVEYELRKRGISL